MPFGLIILRPKRRRNTSEPNKREQKEQKTETVQHWPILRHAPKHGCWKGSTAGQRGGMEPNRNTKIWPAKPARMTASGSAVNHQRKSARLSLTFHEANLTSLGPIA
jgi:hypothetical protein